MYDVTITNGNVQRIIHDHRGASNAQKLPEGIIVDAENSISSFTFTIYPNNAGYESLNANTTQIKVRNTKKSRDDFVGRVLQVKPEMDSNGAVRKTVICEDRLGYLHDSIQPFVDTRHYVGDSTRTGLEEFIDVLLANHNAQVEPYKRIYRGTVTVKPFESSNEVTKGLNWESTFNAIKEKLLKSFGGFIRLRESAGVLYLDYLESIGTTRSTTIEVGRNMRSISKEIDPSGIVTRLVPLGAKLSVKDDEGNEVKTEERLTIASVNGGVEYIESELYAQQFGIKYGTVIFDDVTEASNLKRKGDDWLASNNGLTISYDVDALELSLLGLDIDDFVLYDSYPVKNHLIDTNETLRIIKKTTNVIEPQKGSFEMGSITKRLSDMIIDEMLNVGSAINGTDGKTSYLHIRYSANADGSGMTERPTDSTKYVGMHTSTGAIAPTDPSVYVWSLIRGSDGKDGTDGTAGKDGKDGASYYTWIKYADSPTSGMSDNPEGKKYIGIAYNKTSLSESTSYSAYTWSLIKGEDGSDGINGVDGDDGKTYYTWIQYADDANGKNMTNNPDGKFYIGIAYNKESPIESNVASDYSWSLFRGSDGIDGKDGAAGAGISIIYNFYLASAESTGVTTSTAGWSLDVQTVSSDKPYLWNFEYIILTDGETFMTDPCIIGNYAKDGADGADGKDGVGISDIVEYYARHTSNSTKPTSGWDTTVPTLTATYRYLWNFEIIYFTDNTAKPTEAHVVGVYGDTGPQGPAGNDGANGTDGVGVERITPRYAVGASNTTAPSTPTVAGWSIAAPALSYGQYLWCAYYVQYTNSTAAWTEPFHVRSADQITQAASEPTNPTVGTLWLDTSATPYMLKRWSGTEWDVLDDYSDGFEEVYSYVNTTVSDLEKTARGWVTSVSEETVSKSAHEEFKTLVKNILKMEADNTTMIFQTINEAIREVGDTEASHYAELLTYIRFSEDGIEIGKQGNAITMKLDNDSLDFYNNGTRVAYMSDNTLYITDGRFTRSVRIGNYGFIPEANGSVSFTYLGGES